MSNTKKRVEFKVINKCHWAPSLEFVLCGYPQLPNTFRSALLSVMKMLKLLLLSSAYAIIVKVVQDIKLGTVTEERHHSAQQLQSTLEHIILITEQKLKNASTQLAKQHFDKVIVHMVESVTITCMWVLQEIVNLLIVCNLLLLVNQCNCESGVTNVK